MLALCKAPVLVNPSYTLVIIKQPLGTHVAPKINQEPFQVSVIEKIFSTMLDNFVESHSNGQNVTVIETKSSFKNSHQGLFLYNQVENDYVASEMCIS